MCQNLNAIKANDACPPCGASVLLYFPALKYSKGNVQIPQTWSEIFPEMTLALKKKKKKFVFGISHIGTISKLIVSFVHLLSSSIIQIAKKIFSQLLSSYSLYSLKALSLSSSAPNGNYLPKVSETPFTEGFLFCRNLGFNFSAFLIFGPSGKSAPYSFA